MMAVHAWAANADRTESVAHELFSGKAAALFAVLAGVGIALTSRRDLAAGRVWPARRNLFGRGLAVILLGLTLDLAGQFSVVVTILVYYGVLFWVAIPLLRWSNRSLLIAATVLAVVWPFLSVWLRSGLEYPFELAHTAWIQLFEDPVVFARGLFLTGFYPVPTWIVYALVGIVIGRLVLAASSDRALRTLGGRLLAIGVALATVTWGASALLAGPVGGVAALHLSRGSAEFYETGSGSTVPGNLWWLVSPAPHTGTFFDLSITTGVAIAAIGACLILGTVLSDRARRILEPIRRAGSAPLTIYTLHILAIDAATVTAMLTADMSGPLVWYLWSPTLWILHIIGAILVGSLLTLLNRRGPLETFVTWTGRQFRRSTGAGVTGLPPE
jgi:uncharacterized membrane protein YeiB